MKYKTSQIKLHTYPNVLPFGEKLNEKIFWDIYDKCMKKAKENPGPGQNESTPWIHLVDAVSRGTISPLEAYDAIELGYLPENLKVRESYYSHLF